MNGTNAVASRHRIYSLLLAARESTNDRLYNVVTTLESTESHCGGTHLSNRGGRRLLFPTRLSTRGNRRLLIPTRLSTFGNRRPAWTGSFDMAHAPSAMRWCKFSAPLFFASYVLRSACFRKRAPARSYCGAERQAVAPRVRPPLQMHVPARLRNPQSQEALNYFVLAVVPGETRRAITND